MTTQRVESISGSSFELVWDLGWDTDEVTSVDVLARLNVSEFNEALFSSDLGGE